MERSIESSRQAWAKTAGIALAAIIVVGLTGNVFLSVSGPGPTAQNIMAHELRYRTGVACGFVMLNGDIVLAIALYALLRQVNAPLALLGALWRFANVAVLGVGVVAALTALKLLGSAHLSGATPTQQLQDSAGQFLLMQDTASPIGLTFWSMGAAVHSYLLWQSRCIPRILSGAYLGVALMILAGCFAIMLSPAIQSVIDPWFVFPDLPVEIAVALWLIIKGVQGQPPTDMA